MISLNLFLCNMNDRKIGFIVNYKIGYSFIKKQLNKMNISDIVCYAQLDIELDIDNVNFKYIKQEYEIESIFLYAKKNNISFKDIKKECDIEDIYLYARKNNNIINSDMIKNIYMIEVDYNKKFNQNILFDCKNKEHLKVVYATYFL